MTALGLLIEAAATNLVVQSQNLTTAAWTKLGATTAGTPIVAPDTTMTGIPMQTTASPFPNLNETITVASGTAYSFSGHFRRVSGDNEAIIELTDSSLGQATASISLISGTIDQTRTSAWTINSSSIQGLANGWINIRINATPSFNSSSTLIDFYQTTSTAILTTGTTIGSVMSAWGIQVAAETGVKSSYFPTTTVSAARSADVVVLTVANATYDILVEDTVGAEFRSAVVVGAGAYTLVPRAGQLHVTRVRIWPSSGAGSLTAAQKAAIAPG